jgi:hypothetical protein
MLGLQIVVVELQKSIVTPNRLKAFKKRAKKVKGNEFIIY